MPDAALDRLAADLADAASTEGYSGVILLREGDRTALELALGLANRADERPNTIDTKLATASVTKGFTALAVVSMIEEGRFGFDSTLVDVVGGGVNVDPGVTIEHLLGHTSGVGDYLDEEVFDDPDDYVLEVPVHHLLGPEDFVPILQRHDQAEPPGHRFRYNNGGYLWLALAIERAGDDTYHDEVRRRVFEPAAMEATDFLRSDRLPADTALGSLTDGRTTVFHLPVIGTGDGGAYTTAEDMIRFWDAFYDARIVGRSMVERMTTITNHDPPESYGLGFWIGPDPATVYLEGMDAGVSFRSGINRATGLCFCLIANNSTDVWPLARIVDAHLGEVADRPSPR